MKVGDHDGEKQSPDGEPMATVLNQTPGSKQGVVQPEMLQISMENIIIAPITTLI